MSLTTDDIRAAVSAGVISEAQAVRISALADARRGARSDLGGLDEPFELFRGFNEIFIVVGLSILFSGWMMALGLSYAGSVFARGDGNYLLSLTGIGGLWMMARYFTLRRRMVAPSIALVIMFTILSLAVCATLAWDLGLSFSSRFAFAFALTTLALVGHYAAFRVPITTALIAIGLFAALASWLLASGSAFPDPRTALLLSGSGPFGWLVMGVGIAAFAVAMGLDMSDPHRVTRRSASAFWLHVVAAPAVVNTVAVTLIDQGGNARWLWLALFLAAMALLAIVTDRRSFLMAGVGYIAVLIGVLFEGDYAWAILCLGVALVLLGAQWERMRAAILTVLPDFPGKSRLPPWA